MSDRITEEGRFQIIRMRFLIERNHSKDGEIFIKDHDLLRSLHELNRKQGDAVGARAGTWQASARRVVDGTLVENFLSLLPRPGLKGDGIASSLRCGDRLRRRSRNAGFVAGHLKIPVSAFRTAPLIDAGEVRLAIRRFRRRTNGSSILCR